MPTIDPFGLDPAGAFFENRLSLYWYATVIEASYLPATEPRLYLWQLAGGLDVTRVLPTRVIWPSADISIFPAGRAVLAVPGTQTLAQLVAQILGSPLVPVAPWAGQVAAFHSASTAVLWAAVRQFLLDEGVTALAWSGHSLGGAIATLGPDLALDSIGAVNQGICTLGAPRVGNQTFALDQNYRHWRLTGAADPVPALPPSGNAVLDRWLWVLAPPPLTSFWHTDTRAHLFFDGRVAFPPEQSTWADAETALVNLIEGSTTWYTDHSVGEYARRLRIGIPVPFLLASAEYPGIEVLDGFWAGRPIQPPASSWFEEELCPNQ